MIKINKFILIICFLVLLLIFIICKNDILYFFNNSTNKLLGGNIQNLPTAQNNSDSQSVATTNNVITATVQPSTNNVITATVQPSTENPPTYNPLDVNTEVASLEDTLRNEELKINKIRDELESLRRNRIMDNIADNSKPNSDYVSLDRDIIDIDNTDAINTIVNKDNNIDNMEDSSESDEEDNKETNTGTKAWQNMCENDYDTKRKKHKFMDLKLDLNTDEHLQPFNNDDYSEYGKFNC